MKYEKASIMSIIAVSGYKNSGKSTLCRALLGAFSARGLNVGYIKRTGEFVGSPRGTDSGEVLVMGVPALLWGEGALRFETECGHGSEIDVRELAGKYFPRADIVILEGGKHLKLPRIWVLGENETPPEDAGIFAVYDRHGGGDGERRYGEGEVGRLASDILQKIDRADLSARVYVGGRELPMKDFVADFVAGGIRGMLGALKNPTGVDISDELRVYLKGSRKP
jgi:molybdopterin-guanine dinucleotide biosynthesis protein B